MKCLLSFCRLNSTPLCLYTSDLYISEYIDECLGWFWILAAVNIGAINMGMKISLLSTDFILISCVPNSGLCLTSLPKMYWPEMHSWVIVCFTYLCTCFHNSIMFVWKSQLCSALGSRKSDTSLKTAFASQGLLLFWLSFIIDFQFLWKKLFFMKIPL